MIARSLLSAAAVSCAFWALPAASAIEYIEVQSAPPAPQVEVVPAPREGSLWIPGYWNYQDQRYVWVPGHFEAAREGYVYVPPKYEEHEGRWRMHAGGWARDEDEEHGGARNRIKSKIKGDRDEDEEHGGLRNRILGR